MRIKCFAFVAVMLSAAFHHSATGQNSVLASGNWYKISVQKTGVHRITYDDLLSYGINPGVINPKYIRIYGNGNGMLPEPVDSYCYDDLQEIAIYVFGEEDEVFDPGDYVLFYGEGSTEWVADEFTGCFEHLSNIYSDRTIYFINADLGLGKRIQEQYSTAVPFNYTSNSFNDYWVHEEEFENLMHSGREWFGESFDTVAQYSFQAEIPLTDSIAVLFATRVAARSTVASNVDVNINDKWFLNLSVASAPPNSTVYARDKKDTLLFTTSDTIFNITFTYDQPNDSSIAWLDYFTLNVRRNLAFQTGQMNYRDWMSSGSGTVTKFKLEHPTGNAWVWNITDPLNPLHVNHDYSGGYIEYNLETESLLEFTVFDGSEFFTPEFEGETDNQNLHGHEPVDLLIVAKDEFVAAAQQLADFRLSNDGISAWVVTPGQIYNEFSSGSQDVMAIRNFVKLIHQNTGGQQPEFLLLFGDGSYNYRDTTTGNSNLVPVWQSPQSLNWANSYCTDDLYVIFNNDNLLDIAVGRLPVRTVEEAEVMVQKLVEYGSNEDAYGSWRNEFCLVADDEDGNLHLECTENVAGIAETEAADFNLVKIYLDAYPQVTIGGEDFYPGVNEALTNKINDGVSIINFVGHGWYKTLAHEQIFTADDVQGLTNSTYPFLYASTGDFGRFDDPEIYSLMDKALFLPGKGMIAVISPSRSTYAGINSQLQEAFYSTLFENPALALGKAFAEGKNNIVATEIKRRSFLFSDPALRIATPMFNVVTEMINGQDVNLPLDTVHPGEQVVVSGIITDWEGNPATGFNGLLHVKVYERIDTAYTHANDPNSYSVPFETRDSVLLEVETQVVNGTFEAEFSLPSFMFLYFGTLKISYYAEDFPEDATGHFSDLVVGGLTGLGKVSDPEDQFLTIFPTLISGEMHYRVNRDVRELTLGFYDPAGNRVMTNTGDDLSSGELYSLDLSSLPSGFYIVKAEAGEYLQFQKIIRK